MPASLRFVIDEGTVCSRADRSMGRSSLSRRIAPRDSYMRLRHFGVIRQPKVRRTFWATLTERQRPNECDQRRVLGHYLAPSDSMLGASEERWMEPSARD